LLNFKDAQWIQEIRIYDNTGSSKSLYAIFKDHSKDQLVFEYPVVKSDEGKKKMFLIETESKSKFYPIIRDTIEFQVSPLYEYKNIRLYNVAGNSSNGLKLYSEPLPSNGFKQFDLINIKDTIAFHIQHIDRIIQNTPNEPYVNFKDNLNFKHSICSSVTLHPKYPPMGPGTFWNTSNFVKSDIGYDNLTDRNLITLEYLKHKSQATFKLDKVAVGETYVIEIVADPRYDMPKAYGVIKILSIIDDGLTSKTGGNDDDYIEIDFKYFAGRRFGNTNFEGCVVWWK
jgi:hypothetical protein